MSINNAKILIKQTNLHVKNINHQLKGAKSEVKANFICYNSRRIIITTNKTAISSDLNIIDKYIMNVDYINLKDISSSCLL